MALQSVVIYKYSFLRAFVSFPLEGIHKMTAFYMFYISVIAFFTKHCFALCF